MSKDKKYFTDIYKADSTFFRSARVAKAKKMLAVIRDDRGVSLSKLICLDVGCSVGLISEYFGRYFGKVVGADTDRRAVEQARRRVKLANISFVVSGENKLPFKDESFDVVIFSQVYEHSEDPSLLVGEIKRVLRRGGICFFGARNRFWIFDGHYPLPFLSCLPRAWEKRYFQMFMKGRNYDIKLFSHHDLVNLAESSGFRIHDYTLRIIKNPKKYSATDVVPTFWGANNLLYFFAKIFYTFVPNYIWVLKKR